MLAEPGLGGFDVTSVIDGEAAEIRLALEDFLTDRRPGDLLLLYFSCRGRVVLTASRATEYSFEGDPVPGSVMTGSVFTIALLHGIKTGEADLDRDGYVSVDVAYA